MNNRRNLFAFGNVILKKIIINSTCKHIAEFLSKCKYQNREIRGNNINKRSNPLTLCLLTRSSISEAFTVFEI